MKMNKSTLWNVLSIIGIGISILVIGAIGGYLVLIALMYMIIAMVVYGTIPVFIAVAGFITIVLTVTLIVKIRRRKRIYRWRN